MRFLRLTVSAGAFGNVKYGSSIILIDARRIIDITQTRRGDGSTTNGSTVTIASVSRAHLVEVDESPLTIQHMLEDMGAQVVYPRADD